MKELFGFTYTDKKITDLADNEINLSISKFNSKKDDITHFSREINQDYLKLEIPSFGRFIVKNGNAIAIKHNTSIEAEDSYLFLYGSCMGALLFQRNFIPLHGSAVITNKGAVLFLGNSGAGKSTIAAALHKRGYNIISDDISALTLDNKNVSVIPSNADIKLWQQSLNLLDEKNEKLTKVRSELEKYYFPAKGKHQQNCKIAKIYIISTHNKDEIVISDELKGLNKFNAISNNTYRKAFIDGLNKKQLHFAFLSTLLAKTPVKRITRPDTGNLNKLIDSIEQEINQ